MQPRVTEVAPLNLLDLPQHLPGNAPALNLIRALRAQGLTPPAALFRRHRAGIEQLFEEMAHEYLDGRRLGELEKVLERERVVADSPPRHSALSPASS